MASQQHPRSPRVVDIRSALPRTPAAPRPASPHEALADEIRAGFVVALHAAANPLHHLTHYRVASGANADWQQLNRDVLAALERGPMDASRADGVADGQYRRDSFAVLIAGGTALGCAFGSILLPTMAGLAVNVLALLAFAVVVLRRSPWFSREWRQVLRNMETIDDAQMDALRASLADAPAAASLFDTWQRQAPLFTRADADMFEHLRTIEARVAAAIATPRA